MDPEQAFKEIMAEITDGNMGAALDLYRDLRQWVKRGGFPPSHKGWKREIELALNTRR